VLKCQCGKATTLTLNHRVAASGHRGCGHRVHRQQQRSENAARKVGDLLCYLANPPFLLGCCTITRPGCQSKQNKNKKQLPCVAIPCLVACKHVPRPWFSHRYVLRNVMHPGRWVSSTFLTSRHVYPRAATNPPASHSTSTYKRPAGMSW
jgi:hypothetical protein